MFGENMDDYTVLLARYLYSRASVSLHHILAGYGHITEKVEAMKRSGKYM